MRILQVVQELGHGGAERVVVSLARAAADAGHVVAVAGAPGPLADELGIPVYNVPLVRRSPVRGVLGTLAIARAAYRWRADVVHAHNPAIGLAAGIATLRGHLRPALVTMHGVPEEDYPAAARAFRLSGLPVIACGPGVAAALEKQRVRVRATIVNGVTTPPPADRAGLERLAGGRGGRIVVNVGRLVPQKNQALAIRALAVVPDTVLVVIGSGPLRGELAREAERVGVAERVVLAGARGDARALLGAADGLVLSSEWEGLPLVALEALAAGTPVVATAVRGVRELLRDGENARIVPPRDAPALGAALAGVLTDAALAERLAAGGRALVADYTEARMAEAYLSLYERLAQS